MGELICLSVIKSIQRGFLFYRSFEGLDCNPYSLALIIKNSIKTSVLWLISIFLHLKGELEDIWSKLSCNMIDYIVHNGNWEMLINRLILNWLRPETHDFWPFPLWFGLTPNLIKSSATKWWKRLEVSASFMIA